MGTAGVRRRGTALILEIDSDSADGATCTFYHAGGPFELVGAYFVAAPPSGMSSLPESLNYRRRRGELNSRRPHARKPGTYPADVWLGGFYTLNEWTWMLAGVSRGAGVRAPEVPF